MRDIKQLLTLENCHTIIQKHLGHRDFAIEDYDIEPLEHSLDGLIGEQYTVSITYKYSSGRDKLRAFFKILNGNSSTMFELSKEIKAFEKEDFFYNCLAPEISKCGLDMSFIPKCYLCVPYTVVLEDLSLEGFHCADKFKLLDLERCKCSMDILAKFHAAGIVYEIKKSLELGRPFSLLKEYPEMLDDVLFSREDTPATRWAKCSIEGLFNIIDLIPENSISNDKFKLSLKNVIDDILSSQSDDLKCSILHGDLWCNNFLYKCDKDAVTDAKLIDFQTLKYGPVALDVEQFIMTNTRKMFRDNHEHELLEHYYKSFSEIVKRHGYIPEEILSRDDFITSCRLMKLPAKIQATVDRSLTLMSDEVFEEVMKDEERFRKFLFSDRGKYIIESYTKNDQFKDVILEDMLELRDLLFSN